MPYADIEVKKAYDKIYYQKHKEKMIDRANKWANNNPDKARYIRKASFARRKLMDKNMTAELAQRVYEDNIKKYGTLTCVVCGKHVVFGDDNLEHNIPLSRGGTHDYDNLGVSHHSCNSRKNKKTLKEYKGGFSSYTSDLQK